MKRLNFILFFVLWCNTSFSQDSLSVFLTLDEYLNIVKTHHPVAYQANLRLREGEAYLQKGKAGFDPKLQGSVRQKYFDDKKYYSYVHGGVKIPLWFGIETELGYNDNEGYNLNPESFLEPTGLWNFGISIDVGNGLLIDQRRADLKQARLIRNSSELTQKIMLNQLMLDATISYLEWQKSYNKLKLAEENVEAVKVRFGNVLESVAYGDKPAIDTVKLSIQLYDRQLKLKEAILEYKNKTIYLNTFLWQDGFIPLELNEDTKPKITNQFDNVLPVIDFGQVVVNHPEYLMEKNNIGMATINYRLKREALRPDLKIKYNALSSDQGNGVFNDYDYENYYWSATMSYAIFTRKERADIELTRIKLEGQNAKLASKEQQIKYKVESTYNAVNSLKEQVEIQQESVELYRQLLQSELTLFNIGESSMFLVNTREQNYIQAQLKLIETMFVYRVAVTSFRYHLFQY